MERTASAAAALILLVFLSAASALRAGTGEVTGKITYISASSVYIDIGTSSGLAPGDTLRVMRDLNEVGDLVVSATAPHSSSCTPLVPIRSIQVGDQVSGMIDVLPAPLSSPGESEISAPATRERQAVPGAGAAAANQMHGRISLGSYVSEDLTESALDFAQPTISASLKVRNLAGTPLAIEFRQRLRHTGRESEPNSTLDEDRWTARLFELALLYEKKESPLSLRAGRFSPSEARGIGYLDGGMVRYAVKENLVVGGAGGLRPDYFDAGFGTREKAFGVFTRYERKNPAGRRISGSAAFSGTYGEGTVSREFFYFDGGYSVGSRFSTLNSVEIDLNRDWRKSQGKSSFELTGVFLTARYALREDLSVGASFDNRKNLRTLHTREVPDSLFDDSLRRGVHANVSWALSPRMKVDGSFGIRTRDGFDDTVSGSGALRISDFIRKRLSLHARLSVFRMMFSRGYRPSVGLGLPPMGDLTLGVSGGSYIYDVGGSTSSNPWVESTANYRLSRRTYLSATFWSDLSGGFQSAKLFSEVGFLF